MMTKTNTVESASKARYQIQTRSGLVWDIHSAVSAIKLARQWARDTAARGYAVRLVDTRTDAIVPFQKKA